MKEKIAPYLILRSSRFGIAGPIQAEVMLCYPVTFSQMKLLVFIFQETLWGGNLSGFFKYGFTGIVVDMCSRGLYFPVSKLAVPGLSLSWRKFVYVANNFVS